MYFHLFFEVKKPWLFHVKVIRIVKLRYLFFCLGGLLMHCYSVKAQINSFLTADAESQIMPRHQTLYLKARLAFENELFLEALPLFDSLIKVYPKSISVKYLGGICKIYSEEQKKQSIKLLLDLNEHKHQLEFYSYFLAYAYEKNDSISASLAWYNLSVSEEKVKSKPNKELINQASRRIENLKTLEKMKLKINPVEITNIGPPINTEGAEYVPLITSDEEFMVYTYRGKLSKGGKQHIKKSKLSGSAKKEDGIYFEDVFMSYKINDTTWGKPLGIKSINTNLHDAAVSLSADGTQLFVYKNMGTGNGDLYLSTLQGSEWAQPKYQKGLNSDKWDGSACFLPDNRFIIISSERKGGYGGKDLYIAEKLGNDLWGNIKNLGPDINTEYDEDAPFVTADGKTLFFSSNGKLSTGGYDILRSDFKEGKWSKPYNLGEPINTRNDDKFFCVSGNEKKAYYSSVKSGGYGDQDIYVIEPGIPGKPLAMVEVVGNVTLNNKPCEANIQVKSKYNTRFKVQNYISNSVSGKFLINLSAGDEYELIFSNKNLEPQTKIIHTVGIDSFIQIRVIADFYDAADTKMLQARADSLAKAEKLFYDNNTDEFNNVFGDEEVDSLSYHIQVGAYKFYENFNYTPFLKYGKLQRRTLHDGITRFTLGSYTRFGEAFKSLKDINEKAIKEAFIIAIYKKKRYYLSDLVKEGIIRKKPN